MAIKCNTSNKLIISTVAHVRSPADARPLFYVDFKPENRFFYHKNWGLYLGFKIFGLKKNFKFNLYTKR